MAASHRPTRRDFLGVLPVLALAACRRDRAAPPRLPFDPDDPAFDPDPEGFPIKHVAAPGDWLAVHPEPDQSFEVYIAQSPVRPTGSRARLVLQPLGDLDDDARRLLVTLGAYTEAFFDRPVDIASARPLPDDGRRVRGGHEQFQTRAVLDEVLAPALPDDAIAYLGITMADLYPEPGWNFVFGEASLGRRIGVYSLARFFPAFDGGPDDEAARRLGLLRSCKVLAHETAHMFSLRHCVLRACVMNGSNSLAETDRAPHELCPTCLKKLQWNLRFDVRARYARLAAVFRREGLAEQASWIEARSKRVGSR
jgi:archaemetzincin